MAAGQAAVLQAALLGGAVPDRRLQRKLSEVADLPWSIATGADLRQPSANHTPAPQERLFGLWVERLARLAAAGDAAATVVFSQIYNLTATPSMLFHPLLVGGVLRSLLAPLRTMPRPAVLDAISPDPGMRRSENEESADSAA